MAVARYRMICLVPVTQVNPTSRIAVVTTTGRFKSVWNSDEIERFVFLLCVAFFVIFCRYIS